MEHVILHNPDPEETEDDTNYLAALLTIATMLTTHPQSTLALRNESHITRAELDALQQLVDEHNESSTHT